MSAKKKSTKKNKKNSKPDVHPSRKLIYFEIAGAVCVLLAVLIWLSLFNYSSDALKDLADRSFITGIIGFNIANMFATFAGYSSFFVPILLTLFATMFIYNKLLKYFLINLLLFIVLLPFFQMISVDPLSWGITGGWLGKIMVDKFFIPYIGVLGTYLIFFFMLIIYIIISLRVALITNLFFVAEKLCLRAVSGIQNFFKKIGDIRFLEKGEQVDTDQDLIKPEDEKEPVHVEINQTEEIEQPAQRKIAQPSEPLNDAVNVSKELREDIIDVQADNEKKPENIAVQSMSKTIEKEKKVLRKLKDYKLPPLSLLTKNDNPVADKDREKRIQELALLIERKLLQYKIKVSVKGATIGPVVTMYEIELGDGVRVSQVAKLAPDIGIVVGGKRVRVVSRIPGKPYIGIEVPNEDRLMIYLRSILSSKEFDKQRSRGLPVVLGQVVDGTSIAANLSKMPHLLVAGTTGSGKSVGVNTFIVSILYNMSPEETKFIMIDPKGNEFNIYEGIPHLLLPVVTDSKKAALAMKWAVDEMENRFSKLAENMVRDIGSYNEKVANINKNLKNEEQHMKKMPYIVVVIDEFADLMMVAGKDVEIAVTRIAQKARAVGIHLIIATQRPTRDVITGLIKGNLPVRIAFRVASALDSRTILDCNGAEVLLGNGDMLYIPPGSSEPMRVHGAFVSTEEIKAIVKYIKDQFPDGYDIGTSIDLSSSPADFVESSSNMFDAESDEDKDPLHEEVVTFIRKTRKCSASMLQRNFKIGYNRAARIVEVLEAEGLISAGDGAKQRKVLMPPEEGASQEA